MHIQQLNLAYSPLATHIFLKDVEIDLLNKIKSIAFGIITKKDYLNTYKALHLGGTDTPMSRLIRSAAAKCHTHTKAQMDQRLSTYREVSAYLKKLKNSELLSILNTAIQVSKGCGGEIFRTQIKGISVIIKKISLTKIEQKHPKSTGNIFNLPLYYHYGVDSTGFGSHREVQAHKLTTAWVLNEDCHNFPIMYHKTVTPRSVLNSPQLKEEYVEYWNNSVAIRERIDALDNATAETVIFMEDLSQTFDGWFEEETNRDSLDSTKINAIIREAESIAHFMRSHQFHHFDLNPFNIFFHNDHLYLADFGLTICNAFQLDDDEKTFFKRHVDYDRSYLAKTVACQLLYATKKDRAVRIVGKYLSGEDISALVPQEVALYASKHQRIAILFETFFKNMCDKSKSAQFPESELRYEWDKLS